MAGYPLTIVGVVPEGFHGTWLPTILSADFWAPMVAAGRLRTVQGPTAGGPHRTFALLRAGVSAGQVEAAISTIGRAVHVDEPDVGVAAVPARRAILFDEFASPGLLIGTVVVALSSLVFLIACANLTNLLLVRAISRKGEIAVRLALGASQGRVFRLLLTETALLTGGAGAVGLLLTWATTAAMTRVPLPQLGGISIRFDPSPDWRVFAFAFAIAAVAAIAVGLLPAWRASRVRPLNVLVAGGSSATQTPRGQRLRAALVTGQVALSIVLLVLAGLYVRSALAGQRFDPGYDTSHGTMASVDLRLQKADEARGRLLIRRMLDAVSRIPGVERAAIVGGLGMAGSSRTTLFLLPEGETLARRGFGVASGYAASYAEVSPGFFQTLHVPLKRGRGFTAADDAAAPGVVIVTDAVAARFWPGEDPLGHRLSLDQDGPLLEVVGVAGAMAESLTERPRALFVYVPLDQHYDPALSVVVTSSGSPAAMIAPLSQAIRLVDLDMVPFDVRTVADTAGLISRPSARRLSRSEHSACSGSASRSSGSTA